MHSRAASLVVLLLAFGLAWPQGAAPAGQGKVAVKHVFTEGAARTYHLVAKLVRETGHKDITAEMTIGIKCASLEKDTGANMVAEFSAQTIDVEWRDVSAKVKTPPSVKYVLGNDGNLIKLTTEAASEEAKLAKLLVSVLSVPLPEGGAAAGDKWKAHPKEGADIGFPGTSTYEFVGPEDLPKNVKALKIKYEFKTPPDAGGTAFTVNGNVWLDPATGDCLQLKADVSNFVLNGEMFSGTLEIGPKADK